ncbi:MAG: hypothetical protein AAGJ79_03270 [Verrucomicrobiota bacterium]
MDETANVGLHASLALVAGRPAISYLEASNENLKFAISSDPLGTGSWTEKTLVTEGFVGFYSSLAVVDGFPAIAFYNATTSTVWFMRAEDATGDVWDDPVEIETGVDLNEAISLVVVDGVPAVSYVDDGNGELKIVYAEDAQGRAWGTPVVIDSPDVDGFCEMALIGGLPGIAYVEANTAAVDFVRYRKLPALPTWSAATEDILAVSTERAMLAGTAEMADVATNLEGGSILNPSFIGTDSFEPLQFSVNDSIGFRLESQADGETPVLIGGFEGNSIGIGSQGAVIAGGGADTGENTIAPGSEWATISGGVVNQANAIGATVGGGELNQANGNYSTVGGGLNNRAGLFGTAAGGRNSFATGDAAAIGGGLNNTANGNYATIPGGNGNVASAD